MTGTWNCHPDLEAEWNSFAAECKEMPKSDLTAELWMGFWRSEGVHANRNGNLICEPRNTNSDPEPGQAGQAGMGIEKTPPSVSHDVAPNESPVEEATLSDSQVKQVTSLTHEIVDILEVDSGEIPDDIREEISSLPNCGLAVLLNELRAQLSDEGAYKLCLTLCELDEGPWMNVPLVFSHFLLPVISGDGLKHVGAGIEGGVLQLSERFPSESVSHLLKPLLVNELTPPRKSELIARLILSLPEKDFLSLLRQFILQCSSPIEEWQIKVLNSMLSDSRIKFLETIVECPLTELIPVLASSARVKATCESFASLLLKVISALKHNNSSRVSNELTLVVQQNCTFNKQALMNAVRSLGP